MYPQLGAAALTDEVNITYTAPTMPKHRGRSASNKPLIHLYRLYCRISQSIFPNFLSYNCIAYLHIRIANRANDTSPNLPRPVSSPSRTQQEPCPPHSQAPPIQTRPPPRLLHLRPDLHPMPVLPLHLRLQHRIHQPLLLQHTQPLELRARDLDPEHAPAPPADVLHVQRRRLQRVGQRLVHPQLDLGEMRRRRGRDGAHGGVGGHVAGDVEGADDGGVGRVC